MYQKQKALEKHYFTFLQWTNNWRVCNDLLDAVNNESNMSGHKFTSVFCLENKNWNSSITSLCDSSSGLIFKIASSSTLLSCYILYEWTKKNFLVKFYHTVLVCWNFVDRGLVFIRIFRSKPCHMGLVFIDQLL